MSRRLICPRLSSRLACGLAVLVAWGGGGLAEEAPNLVSARQHWAYRPVAKPESPELPEEWAARRRQPLDVFVFAKLSEHGLALSPAADRSTLIRRAYFDLLGTPPPADEVDTFVSDPSRDEDVMVRLIDRLLADPGFGERWGRYWLDVARYADSKGYVFQEERRYPYSYTFRDWVISAFNEDLPFDQFILAQLAADQSLGLKEPRHLAAMGFLTLGRRFLNNQHDIIDDRLDVTFRGLQATTIACARCHDHKFDPIPTDDYYSLYGVFASSEEPGEKPLLGEPEGTPEYLAFEAELKKKEQAVADFYRGKKEELFTEEMIGKYLRLCAEGWNRDDDGMKALAKERQLYASVAVRWRTHMRQLGPSHPVAGLYLALIDVPAEQWAARMDEVLAPMRAADTVHPQLDEALRATPPGSMEELAALYAKLLASHNTGDPLPDEAAESLRLVLMSPDGPQGVEPMSLGRDFSVAERDQARNLRNDVENFKATAENGPPRAMALVDKEEVVDPVVFKRGSPGNRGYRVPRQFLGVLAGPNRQPFSRGSGRLELAETIASRSNPLTARVYVNRVWAWLTGQWLVDSPSDFGLRTPKPTNPELLEHLAFSFMENGWSTKKLVREIVLSASWQQGSVAPDHAEAGPPAGISGHKGVQAARMDPENTLLWKMNRRRRDFESFRDTLLTVSGRLDPKMGGRPVSLDHPQANRRTVYGFIDRQNLPGLFRSFDFASPDQHAPKRFQTTVPQQALFALNNPFVIEQARALAALSSETDSDRVRMLFRRVLGRNPEPDEMKQSLEFVSAPDRGQTAGAWEYGTGEFDATTGTVRFQPFTHHEKDRWTRAAAWPEPELGHATIQREGGHPGPDTGRGVIWRWRSPTSGTLLLAGSVERPSEQGDGVRLQIAVRSHGVVHSWPVPASGRVSLDGITLPVVQGETVDFLVDPVGSDHSDSFQLDLKLQTEAGQLIADAREEFSGPPLDAWVAFAQVLLMSNELMFVD